MISPTLLTGQDTTSLLPLPFQGEGAPLLQAAVLPALVQLREHGLQQGFDLRVASGFRGFESQLRIWNAKARGERPVLDDGGVPLDIFSLAPRERVFAILRWSALPGASRHHWGTDLDVYDQASLPPNYRLRLTPDEVAPEGVLGRFHQWLGSVLPDSGFFRPYFTDRGGVAPELWHLSYAPLAREYSRALTPEVLRAVVAASDLELKSAVLAELDTIHARFVAATD
jgi:LAS superfamily LD-carboxypeptidase LdcB